MSVCWGKGDKMDLNKIVKKNPLCLMSINTTVNMYDRNLTIPTDVIVKLIEWQIHRLCGNDQIVTAFSLPFMLICYGIYVKIT